MKFLAEMRYVKVALVVAAVLIAAVSLVISHYLIRDLVRGEETSMEVWAEAMRALQRADETTDLGLVLSVINGNNTIPVIVLDGGGEVLAARNVGVEQDSLTAVLAGQSSAPDMIRQLKERANDMREAGRCISISLGAQETESPAVAEINVCYENSIMLRRLATYPYVQLGVVALFIAVAILALLSSKRAEQNKVWVGLSRETAHQLGTPLSSLMAASEILRDSYPQDPLLPEMDKDIRRLQLIAERFSKIGSTPVLAPTELSPVVQRVADYMRHRASNRVRITAQLPPQSLQARLNAPLFEWVIENLCKNAIDAMAGAGSIDIRLYQQGRHAYIEVSDTGRGIPRSNFKRVFKPGYTTKQRGWGLGLSLAKRIVEEYHQGRIYVKDSVAGQGTTFCIQLPACLS